VRGRGCRRTRENVAGCAGGVLWRPAAGRVSAPRRSPGESSRRLPGARRGGISVRGRGWRRTQENIAGRAGGVFVAPCGRTSFRAAAFAGRVKPATSGCAQGRNSRAGPRLAAHAGEYCGPRRRRFMAPCGRTSFRAVAFAGRVKPATSGCAQGRNFRAGPRLAAHAGERCGPRRRRFTAPCGRASQAGDFRARAGAEFPCGAAAGGARGRTLRAAPAALYGALRPGESSRRLPGARRGGTPVRGRGWRRTRENVAGRAGAVLRRPAAGRVKPATSGCAQGRWHRGDPFRSRGHGNPGRAGAGSVRTISVSTPPVRRINPHRYLGLADSIRRPLRLHPPGHSRASVWEDASRAGTLGVEQRRAGYRRSEAAPGCTAAQPERHRRRNPHPGRK
jgi:hypothetical protein